MSCRFLTETDESPWRDCGYASWLMALDDAGVHLPLGLTKAEREALEDADDRPDETGAKLSDLVTGTLRRYHLTYSPWKGAQAAFLTELGPDGSACLNILYSQLPVWYQRWDRHFAAQGLNSRHSVNVRASSSVDGTVRLDYLWLRDPLGRGGYCGEWITHADIFKAARAFGGGVVEALISQPIGDAVTTVTVTVLPYGGGTFVIPANTEVKGWKLHADGTIGEPKTWAPHGSASSAPYDATVSSSAVTGNPFVRCTSGYFDGYIISSGAVTETPNPPPTPPDPPPPPPFTVVITVNGTGEVDSVTST